MTQLNEKQMIAVETTEGPVLIIAGAGTGKTSTLTARTEHLLSMGVNPKTILLLTFTKKAADEMKTRIVEKMGAIGNEITATTYHSFCAAELRSLLLMSNNLVPISPSFSILDSRSSKDAVSLVMGQYESDLKDKKAFTAKFLRDLFSYVANQDIPTPKNGSIDVIWDKKISEHVDKFFPEHLEDLDLICKLRRKYQDYKVKNNLLDYDDIIYYFNYILDRNESLRHMMSSKFRYKMVDEFQDSNKTQLHLIYNLTRFGNDNIAVVGDDQQSIYAFRGANFKNIMMFPKMFEGTKVIILEKNYRSSQFILDLSNAVIVSAKEKYDKQLLATKGEGDMPVLFKARDQFEEVRYIMKKIEELVYYGGYSYSDIAIIQRSSQMSFLLEAELTKNKIDFQKFGGASIMESVIMGDVLAILKTTMNPKDGVAWYRLLQLYPKIGKKTAYNISVIFESEGLEGVTSSSTMKKYEKFQASIDDIVSEHQKMVNMSVVETVNYVLNKYYPRLRKELIAVSNKKQEAKNKMELNLKKELKAVGFLADIAEKYTSMVKFVTDLTLESDTLTKDDFKLTITTIHSVKGKEYPVVFVIGNNDGEFPRYKTQEEKEEERRCFYVAVTRAKDKLFITSSNELSEFLTEGDIIRETYEVDQNGLYKQDKTNYGFDSWWD